MDTYLGALCKRGHDNGHGKSIRRKCDSVCIECSRVRKQEQKASRPSRRMIGPKQWLKTTLGPLCEFGHEWHGTGLSKRYRSDGLCTTCKVCDRATRSACKREPERSKAWRRAHPDEAAASSAAKVLAASKRKNERRRSDDRLTIEARLRSRLYQAMKNGYGFVGSQKYGIDWKAIVDHLGPCPGPREDWHIDHIVPLCSYDLTDEFEMLEAFRPENHRWLPKAENMKKSAIDRTLSLRCR